MVLEVVQLKLDHKILRDQLQIGQEASGDYPRKPHSQGFNHMSSMEFVNMPGASHTAEGAHRRQAGRLRLSGRLSGKAERRRVGTCARAAGAAAPALDAGGGTSSNIVSHPRTADASRLDMVPPKNDLRLRSSDADITRTTTLYASRCARQGPGIKP